MQVHVERIECVLCGCAHGACSSWSLPVDEREFRRATMAMFS
jgi:hypothetical protein